MTAKSDPEHRAMNTLTAKLMYYQYGQLRALVRTAQKVSYYYTHVYIEDLASKLELLGIEVPNRVLAASSSVKQADIGQMHNITSLMCFKKEQERTSKVRLLGREQCVRGAVLVAGAACAADAVHMRIDVLGGIQIDYRLDGLDVQPARRNVGGHEHVFAPRAELLERLRARVLVHIAVDGSPPAHGQWTLQQSQG